MSDFSNNNYGSSHHAIEENWLISYGDLVTILLVFFVLLISASRISSVKFERIKNAFVGPQKAEFSLVDVHDKLMRKIEEEKLQDLVEVKQDDHSIAVIIKNKLLFDLGKADLKQENLHVIEEIVKVFQELPEYAHIGIEGHTDDNPVKEGIYRSNWHLSVLRALSVMEEFDKLNICKDNCEVRGFGEYQPAMPNRDKEGHIIEANQSQNRRVVIRVF